MTQPQQQRAILSELAAHLHHDALMGDNYCLTHIFTERSSAIFNMPLPSSTQPTDAGTGSPCDIYCSPEPRHPLRLQVK